MSVAALGEVGAGAAGAEPQPIVAAAERVGQLRALIAVVEQRPSSTSFATTLDAAQATVEPAADSEGAYPTAYHDASPATYTTPSTAIADAPLASTGAVTLASTPAGAGEVQGAAYVPMIEQAAARWGIDPALLYGLIEQESGFDPSARSGAGALGLTQLMPGTAASLGVAEPLDPAEAIAGGARYLAQLLGQFGGNTDDALAAYNAGPDAVRQYGGVPPYPETEQYVSKVLGYAAAYGEGTAGAAPTQVGEVSA